MPSVRDIVGFFYLVSVKLSGANPLRAASPSQVAAAATQLAATATPTSLSIPTNVVYPPTLPLVAGPSSLPPPPSNLTLVHITIGTGIQNYTCGSNHSAAPVAVGAVATLYDVTALAFLSSSTVSSIPAIAAYQPLSRTLIPNTPLTIPGLGSFPILGYHVFGANGTPEFHLYTVGELLMSEKIAAINAPANATVGVTGSGAVQWLALTAKPGAGSVGLSEVFRVDTAGGNPPLTCEGYADGELISVQYSAAYHFYA